MCWVGDPGGMEVDHDGRDGCQVRPVRREGVNEEGTPETVTYKRPEGYGKQVQKRTDRRGVEVP